MIEANQTKGFRATYQKLEARFMLRAGTVTSYFSAHDDNTDKGINWLQLRIDVLSRANQKNAPNAANEPHQPND